MNSLRLYSSWFMDVSRVGSYHLACRKNLNSRVAMHSVLNRPCNHTLGQTTNVTLLASYSRTQINPIFSSCKLPINSFLVKDKLLSKQTAYLAFAKITLNKRSFWSISGMANVDSQDKVSATASTGDSAFPNPISSGSNDWTDILNQTYHSIGNALGRTTEMVKETSNDLAPHIHRIIDSQPYIKEVIIPVGGTFSATLLAWFVLPRLLRRLYKYSIGSPLSLLVGRSSEEQIPYERSLWSALEDPARYLVTFMAFSQLAVVIVPSTSVYLSQAWRGAVVLSFIWFLQRWKGNAISRALSSETLTAAQQEKLLAVDKISSVGLLLLGAMSFSEACGVAVQSVLTVGGIGGVATAFASKDILGNLLNGLSLQFSKPFSVGDNIKAGSIEGQVVEIGLTTTCLLSTEKFPVMVPNSLFSSQVIVNKSRAQWRAMVSKVPIRVSDVEKIPLLSEDIKSMLQTYPRVFLGKEAPYCFLSRIENSYAELTLGCNLIKMTKNELYVTEQDILLQAVRIIKNHGAELGSTLCDFNCQ